MANAYVTVDLSTLAAPEIIESLDYETILADMLVDLIARDSTYTALVESDPVYKALEVAAYREYMLRQRVNEAAKALLLAFAQDTDLDQIGAGMDMQRLTLTPADDTTVPPTAAVMESDDDYRARIQMSPEGYTNAGSIGAYTFFALSADGMVLDVSVTVPQPGTVMVSVLSRDGDGTAAQPLIDTVTAALNDEKVRPLCDTVLVQSAAILNYSINATLEIYASVDKDAVLAIAQANAQDYANSVHKCGQAPTLAGVYAALFVTGVQNVTLNAPGIQADMVAGDTQASYCTGILLATQVVS
ncbi:baseplate assembly protein [Caballeronia fortuita]|uniref:Baseplate assembly protein n=1 Tax=Caballeronia fortuita TaxID=1777138 RepID=A0A158E8S9_9BURK|nr:baseplate J/gp47 family protein [Caballeronia fortuita]SAL03110.1 baseplate assembly protein [Caballeronia fortuita]